MKSARRSPISRRDSTDLSRRSFLATPAVVSAGMVIPGGVLATSAVGRSDSTQVSAGERPGRVSLAYWPGSARLESFDGLSHTADGLLANARSAPGNSASCTSPICQRLVDAAEMAAGEPRFARKGATVRIHGLFYADGVRLERQTSMAMYVHGGSPDAPAFYAWGFDGRAVSPASQPTQFDVPVGTDSGLNLSFEFNGASAVQERGLTPEHRGFFEDHVVVGLALDSTPGRPKLRRGIYLLTWAGSDDNPIPEWWGYEMEVAASVKTTQSPSDTAATETTDDPRGLLASTVTELTDESKTQLYSRLAPPSLLGRPDFPYLLMSIDYAVNQRALPIG